MNRMNKKTPESHECKQQRRLQKQHAQRQTRLACGPKEQCQQRPKERRLQLHCEAQKHCEQSRRRLKKQTRKHRSDSRLNGSEMPADVSVKQPNKRLAGCCQIKAKVMCLLPWKWFKQQQRRNQQQKYLHNQQLHLQRDFMPSMLTLGLISIEEEPFQMRFKTFRSQVSWSFKIQATGDFNLLLMLCFTLARWFPLLNHNILSSPSRSSNYL